MLCFLFLDRMRSKEVKKPMENAIIESFAEKHIFIFLLKYK
jgi:hypothetical protein